MRLKGKPRLIAVLIIAAGVLSVTPITHGMTRDKKDGGKAYPVTALHGAEAGENGSGSETMVWGISNPNAVGVS